MINSPYEKFYKTENGKFSGEEFLYRWGIASLFHDIGYPVEIIGKQLSKFVNDGSQSISRIYKVDTAVNFNNFDELNSIVKLDPKFPVIYRRDYPETNFIDIYKPTDIMAHQIFTDLFVPKKINAFDNFDKYGDDLYKLMNNLGNFVNYMADNGFIDHGYFSAIFVLNSYAALMQKCYKDMNFKKYAYFFYPVLNSATSILLHNYYRGTLNKDESIYDVGGQTAYITTVFSSGSGPMPESYFPYMGKKGLTDYDVYKNNKDKNIKKFKDGEMQMTTQKSNIIKHFIIWMILMKTDTVRLTTGRSPD